MSDLYIDRLIVNGYTVNNLTIKQVYYLYGYGKHKDY